MRGRIRVQAVWNPVSAVAEQVAADWNCDAAMGLVALLQRRDVRAVLILDPGWGGAVPVKLACREGKHVFLAAQLGQAEGSWRVLHELASEHETTVMPDLGLRYTPATSRLKELIATRLGRPHQLTVESRFHGAVESNGLAMSRAAGAMPLSLIDWCGHLAGTAPESISGEEFGTTAGPENFRELTIRYKRSAAGGAGIQAKIHPAFELPGQTVSEHPAAGFRAEVICAHGRAVLAGSTEIAWETSSHREAESLTSERTDVEVMLDHFSRRVVGGLVPVPSLDDLCRSGRLYAGGAIRPEMD